MAETVVVAAETVEVVADRILSDAVPSTFPANASFSPQVQNAYLLQSSEGNILDSHKRMAIQSHGI
jgi:hypothetical protein